MKKELQFMAKMLIPIAIVAAMAGCVTETTLYKYDKQGNVTEKTVMEKSTGDRVADILGRDEGSWLIIRTGWAAYVSGAMATTEDPTPTVKMHIGSLNFAAAKVSKEQTNAGDVAKAQAQTIGAAFKDLTISAEGAGSSTPDSPASAEDVTK